MGRRLHIAAAALFAAAALGSVLALAGEAPPLATGETACVARVCLLMFF